MGWSRELAVTSRRQRKKNEDIRLELNEMETLLQKILNVFDMSSGRGTGDWNLQEWKMTDHQKTGEGWNLQDWKMTDWKMTK